MTEVLAVFRSRAQAMDCNSRLRGARVAASLVNTPKEANIGCGLSIKFSSVNLPRVRTVIKSAGYSAFFGFYNVNNIYGRTVFSRL